MTAIVWDGKILATDTGVWEHENSYLVSKTQNKIWTVGNFVYSLAGTFSQYWSLREQLKSNSHIEPGDLSVDSESEFIIFDKSNQKEYFLHDGAYLYPMPIKTKFVIGGVGQYAQGLLDAGLDSIQVVKKCIANHSYAAGKCNSLNISEYFEWKTK